jgi:hypothetical protein
MLASDVVRQGTALALRSARPLGHEQAGSHEQCADLDEQNAAQRAPAGGEGSGHTDRADDVDHGL